MSTQDKEFSLWSDELYERLETERDLNHRAYGAAKKALLATTESMLDELSDKRDPFKDKEDINEWLDTTVSSGELMLSEEESYNVAVAAIAEWQHAKPPWWKWWAKNEDRFSQDLLTEAWVAACVYQSTYGKLLLDTDVSKKIEQQLSQLSGWLNARGLGQG